MVAMAPNFLLQFNGEVVQHDVDIHVGYERPKHRPVLKILQNSLLTFRLVGLVANIGQAVKKQHPSHFTTIGDPRELHHKLLV